MADLRTIERESIRAFVQSAADEGYLSGRVLDYGCGKQPYRDIVEAAGSEYIPYDRAAFPANVGGETLGPGLVGAKDSVLCTQVIQYVPLHELEEFIRQLNGSLRSDGHLVLTYPTNWPEVEPEDLHRFTKAGMERLLTEAGFEIVRHDRRATIVGTDSSGHDHFGEFALGYGAVARA